MSFRMTVRRIREAIGSSTVHVPYGLMQITFDLKDAPRPESKLARVARDGGEWWKVDKATIETDMETKE